MRTTLTSLFLFSVLTCLATTVSAQLGDSRIALHVASVGSGSDCPGDIGSQDPNTLGIPCSSYTTQYPVLTGSYVYLSVTRAGAGVLGLSCGIRYDTNLDITWNLCADGLDFPSDGGLGPWPASLGGNRISWSTCQTTNIAPDGVHAVAGWFYVYAYSDDLFRVTPNLNIVPGPELVALDCLTVEHDIIDNPRGSVAFGSGSGLNPCCTPGTITVPGDYATIQEAIDAASCAGDVIQVADGTYSGPQNRNLDFGGKAITLESLNGPASTIIDCAGGVGPGILFQNSENSLSVLDGFTIRNATSGGIYCDGASPTILNCIVENCSNVNNGGGLIVQGGASPTVEGCDFRNNSAYSGGGVAVQTGGSVSLTDCKIRGNSATNSGGGVYFFQTDPSLLSRCYITGNGGATAAGGGIYANDAPLSIISSTIAGNTSVNAGGGARFFAAATVVDLEYSIVQGNCSSSGPELALASSAVANFTCSVVDPAGVVAVSGAAAFYDPDTFSADPLFCAPEPCTNAPIAEGDYTLRSGSPALASVSPCGVLIGAGDNGCTFDIFDIADVGNDQGKQVRIRWHRADDDHASAIEPVTFYGIWRRLASGLAPGVNPLSGFSRPGFNAAIDPFSFPPGDWEFIQSVPASGEAVYIAVAPTLCDSTISSGLCMSTFLIRAQTDVPTTYFDTEPDSGYSVDNLAPAAPLNLLLLSADLVWDEAPEEDFNYYTVYGSDVDMLDPSATVIDYTVNPTLNVASSSFSYFHVTATDFSGNEGDASTTPNTIGVGSGIIPARYALGQAQPNPYRAATRIGFDLPEAGSVRLRVFDVSGRLVRTLVDSPMEAGEYSVPWHGRDDAGRDVPPGMYFYRLESGEYRQTLKAVRVR